MAQLNTNVYNFRIFDEDRSTSEDDRVYENVVMHVAKTDGTYATLYKDRGGNTTLANPFELDQTFKEQKFYTTEAEIQIAVFDYGDNSATDHPNRIGRHAHIYKVTPTSRNKHVYLSRYGSMRVIGIPFLATGTDADDTPASWDNAEANAVIVNGSSDNIILPKGFVVVDAALEVITVDAGETIDVGLLSSESGGDADGFIDGASLATAGFVDLAPSLTTGSNETYVSTASTYGAFFSGGTTVVGTDVNTDTGVFPFSPHICDGTAKTVTVTGSAGIDTAKGMVYLIGYQMPTFTL